MSYMERKSSEVKVIDFVDSSFLWSHKKKRKAAMKSLIEMLERLRIVVIC